MPLLQPGSRSPKIQAKIARETAVAADNRAGQAEIKAEEAGENAAEAKDTAGNAVETAGTALDVAESAAEIAGGADTKATDALNAAGTAQLAADQVALLNNIGDSYTIPSVVLSASDNGDDTATIYVLPHTRKYPDGLSRAIAAGNIVVPNIDPDAREYGIYYTDADRDGIDDAAPPPYVATLDIAAAQIGAEYGRHSLGSIHIPGPGDPDVDGGGYYPPGGTPIRQPI
ncbi:MAG TPA: hypothetical protein VD768_06250 [Sphingomicrobium sp.]|nr:hypothetical protein [Sphingomicrobium sp.]